MTIEEAKKNCWQSDQPWALKNMVKALNHVATGLKQPKISKDS
jgi:hypothetical protein